MSEKTKDILIRAGKTFVQAFLGVLVPELCAVLGGGLNGAGAFKIAITPVICSALAAGISVVWNTVLARALGSGEEDDDDDEERA